MLEAGIGPAPAVAQGIEVAATRQRVGDYELIEEIARGGMGVVFKAWQISLGRAVALKMILTGRLASEVEVRRFRDEARAVAALHHPNIVAIHEVGEIDSQPYFSMDLVEGRNLAEAVREGPFAPARAAGCVKTVAEAIHYAHEHGILHRDLKPSNVLLDAEDRPHVTDFGLAKQLPNAGREVPSADLTLSGQVLGSPNFMPPEQALGMRGELGPASDVYSLGALLYHLLTGRPPFLADSIPATLRLVAETEPVAPRLLVPTVPRDLETICLKCLNKESRRRYSTAKELADELGRFLRDEPIRARAVGRWEKFHRWTRRHPIVAVLTGVIGLLLVAVALISTVAASRLQRANRAGQEKLREAYLSQARANRWSGRPGRRFDSLDVIRKAAEIRPGIDLRNEAIAVLALVDLRESKQWRDVHQVFDATYESYARFETNGTIMVRRVRDETELLRVPGVGIPVHGLGFSPDSRLLAVHYRSETKDYAFKVYDLNQGGKVVLDVPGRWVRFHVFLPDQRILALVWAESVRKGQIAVTFYDLDASRELNSIPLSQLPYGMAAHPDSSKVALASQESPLVPIYAVADGQKLRTLVHSNGVYGLSWSSDGRRLAAACADRFVYLWDVSSEPHLVARLPHEGETIWCHFTQRGDMLMSWGWNLVAKVWNVESRKELLRLPADSVGLFSTDDRWWQVNRVPASSSISEFADGRECRPYHFRSETGASYNVILARDGGWMASGHRDGLRFWNLATGRETHLPESGDTRHLQLTSDGQNLITQSATELLSWPIRSREEGGVTRITIGPPFGMSSEKPGSIQPTNRMAVFSGNQTHIFDAQTLRIERRVKASGSIHAAAISPDGRYGATWVNPERVVKIWDVNDASPIATVPVHHSPHLGFSPDGRWLITCAAEEYVFWQRDSWKPIKTLPRGQTGGSHGRFAFTSDGQMVALAIGRGEVALVDTTTFELLATLESPEIGIVAGLSFTGDGTHLAVTTILQSIHVWDLRLMRRQLAELGLDYNRPPLPVATSSNRPLELTVIGAAVDKLKPALPPRDPGCTLKQIDLTVFYNATLTNSWFNPKWEKNDLSALPRGLQTLDGISFDVRGVVQLASSHPDLTLSYPKEITKIPVQQRCHALHFLHSGGWSTADGTDVGEYVVRYEDDTERTIPLSYAENIWNWWDLPGRTAPMKEGTILAWRGRNPLSDRSKIDLLLFHFRWENPRPNVVISSITFRSRMTQCAPFLVALTAE